MGGLRRVLGAFLDRSQSPPKFVIVGLGNPGEKYLDTRHNVGHIVIDHLVNLLDTAGGAHLGKPLETEIEADRVVLFKPASFVNASGPVIKKILKEYGISSSSLIVIHDDIDLDFAQLRIKQGGSSGGHRGLDSIIDSIATDDFARVRVGLGRLPGRTDPADFVLSSFSDKEWPEIEVVLATAAEAVLAVVTAGSNEAMNKYNKK